MDAKGRVFIPAKWRDDLGDTVIITRDMMGNADSRCLYGMPVELWNDILERFKKVAVSDVKAQNAMRRLFANACECELDKQGRILIAPGLREKAQLEGDIMLAGANNRIEIWNRARWNEEMDDESGFDDETLEALTRIQAGI